MLVGVKHMSRIMEEFLKEEREDETIRLLAILLKSGSMSEENIKELFKLSKKQMQAIKERVTVLA